MNAVLGTTSRTLGLAVLLVLGGCSSAGGSAIRTGPLQLPAYSGPVAVYATGRAPPGAVDLGVVEVHAAQQDATVDMLLPQFVAKVAQIGGNVAVIDAVRAKFDVTGRVHVEPFYYACPAGGACGGTRVYHTSDELMLVTMIGRAMTTQVGSGGAPLIPEGPPPPPLPETPDAPEEDGSKGEPGVRAPEASPPAAALAESRR